MASCPSSARILAWYSRVEANDFAGQELFLIDGDSLLLECFKDKTLDFEAGLQILHAVYLVEQLLQNLARRGCRFHVAFFGTHTYACIPYDKQSSHKYLLTRHLVAQHLKANARDLTLLHFSSPITQDFYDYVEKAKVYFIACSDGASYSGTKTKAISLAKQDTAQGDSCGADDQKVFLRRCIRDYVTSGLDVALLNGIEFRDSKVFCFVIARSVKSRRSTQLSPLSPLAPQNPSISDQCFVADDTKFDLEREHGSLLSALDAVKKSLKLTNTSSRLLFTAVALRKMSAAKNDEFFVKACLAHTVLLEILPLAIRNYPPQQFLAADEADYDFSLRQFCLASCEVFSDHVNAHPLKEEASFTPDYLDGRLLRHVWNALKYTRGQTSLALKQVLDSLCPLISILNGGSIKASFSLLEDLRPSAPDQILTHVAVLSAESSLLPFSHPAFDKHLSSIKIATEEHDYIPRSQNERDFLELSHWHNSKKSLVSKKGHDEGRHRDAYWLKRHQRFLRDLNTYAASLTNASGKVLAPERIFVEPPKDHNSVSASNKKRGKQITKDREGMGSKTATKSGLSKKDVILASQSEKKSKEQNRLVLEAWGRKRADLDKIAKPDSRFTEASLYETDVGGRKDINIIRNEILLYRLAALLHVWKDYCQKSSKPQGYHLVAIALDLLHRLSATSAEVPKEAPGLLNDISHQLRLPVPGLAEIGERSLSFPFPLGGFINLRVEMNPIKFRLLHGGPYMDRSMGSQQDDRVPFQPDAWQKKVLDELDKHTSLLLVVPTGGGKTFISFYAMEKILRANDDDVVVYVAPTKALVNQVAAEITARFTKTYRHGGKALCGIHTRDIRVHNPTQCQVLVTVPHILQIMLLSPTNKDWVPRVKTVIFDEVHSISASEDGVVWEQLLMMAPCQIIALSATVGNPEAFASWLQSTQEAKGGKFCVIQHEHRFSDLRKYHFQPLVHTTFQGLTKAPVLSPLGLEAAKSFQHLHPISSLTSSARTIPADLVLESRDCSLLFDVLKKYETEKFAVPSEMTPEKNFAQNSITKAEVILWAKKLKDFLATWMERTDSPFQEVVAELSKASSNAISDENRNSHPLGTGPLGESSTDDVAETTLSLLQELHSTNALPAILFNFARGRCEEIAITVYDHLIEAEESWKAKSRSWHTKMAAFARWRKSKEATAKKTSKAKKAAGKDKNERDNASGQLSRDERERDESESRDDSFEGFDPDEPLDAFSFANPKKADRNEMDTMIDHLRVRGVNEKLISAFKRGIAAHHAGLNKAYRQAVEIWFRRGYLTAVVATGTLALGINMPCKTVVFTEDSVFLTTLNYRQASGRAGRRGFDLLGNVVFHGISKEKALRLMSSRIPALIGHFPVTTSLVLRLLILLHNTDNAPYAMKMVDSLLTQPRLYLGGESFRHQVLHHLRFSLEYLRRQGLVAGNGAPVNFASCVSHLYYVEQSAFSFHALLRGGYFSDLAERMDINEEETLRTLMLVMAHVFFRCPMRQVEKESEDSELIRKSPSVVFLPSLPEAAAGIMKKHNSETLETYTTYVRTFVEQHCRDPDDTLPFTRLKLSNQLDTGSSQLSMLASSSPSVRLRSPFVALSGHTDDFSSISSLCDTARSGVFLEKAVVPHLEISDGSNPLNAALYDFYQHGAIKPLVIANKVRGADVWFLLNDFSMVLASLVASLESFLNSGGSNYDGDLGSAIEDMSDTLEVESDDDDDSRVDARAKSAKAEQELTDMKIRPSASRAQNKEDVLENWDEEEDDDDEDSAYLPSRQSQNSSRAWKESEGTTRTASPFNSSYVNETASTGYTSESEEDALLPTNARDTEKRLKEVLHMFKRLKEEFDVKFHKIFA